MRRPASSIPSASGRSISASPRSIRSTREAHTDPRASCDAGATSRRRPFGNSRPLALGPVDQAAAYTDLAESYFRGGRACEARKQTLAAARNRAELRTGAGSAAEAGGGSGRDRGPASVGPWHRRWLRSLLVRWCRCCRARRAAQLPDTPDDRFAGLQWRFVRIKYHYAIEGTTRSSRTSTASRGTSMRPRPSRTCRGA